MQTTRWVASVVTVLALTGVARADLDEDGDTEDLVLVPNRPVLGTRPMPSGNAILVVIDGIAPAPEVMRKEVKEAQRRALANGMRRGYEVVISYPKSELLAASMWRDGRYITEIGNRSTTLQDATDYALTVSAIGQVEGTTITSYWSESTRVRCSGTVRNTSSAPIDIGVRCVVYGKFSKEGDAYGIETLPMAEKIQPLGKVPAGQTRNYSFVVTGLKDPTTSVGRLYGRRFWSLVFDTKFLADGDATSHFDAREYAEGIDWLALLAAQRAAGFTLDDAHDRGEIAPTFVVTAAFTELPLAKQKQAALALAAKVNAHYRKHFNDPTLYIHLAKDKIEIGKIENGVYTPK